jgi:hypothetical protein
MSRQLNIRDDDAYRLAHTIADQTGCSVTEVVRAALRQYGEKLPKVDEMTPAQRATYLALRELSRETARRKKPGATSDHSDMYDEFGLPI